MKNVARCLTLCLLVAAPVSARWIPFERSATKAAAAGIRVGGGAERFTIDVTIPGIEVRAEGSYDVLSIPGQAVTMVKRAPELPVFTTSILLPDEGVPEVRIVDFKERVVKTRTIAPSRGPVSRNVPLSSVPRIAGPLYRRDAFYPAPSYEVQVGAPFICRDVRGAALRICPVRYNPVSGEVRVMTSARVEVGMRFEEAGINPKQRRTNTIDGDFAPLYRRLFVNHDLAFKSRGRIDETRGRAIVICPDDWADTLAPLQEWRATKGLDSKLVTVGSILAWAAGGEPNRELSGELLKTYIASEYQTGDLTWILLVGDAEVLPPLLGVFEEAHSDNRLVMLEGDDIIPDAFISRFSCKTAAEVAVQVARTVAYESRPVSGEAAAFYRKAVGIGSGEGETPDYELVEALRQSELAWRFVHVDQIYDPRAEGGDGGDGGGGIYEYFLIWMKSNAYTTWLASDAYKTVSSAEGYDAEAEMWGFYDWMESGAFQAWIESDDFAAAAQLYYGETGEIGESDEAGEARGRLPRLHHRPRRDDGAVAADEQPAKQPYATPEMVAAAVNDGRSLINYMGHGSETEWVTSGFAVGDVANLTNTNGAWPMIWSVACVNGAFAGEYGDCFAEAWLKAGTVEAPAGAIGMVGASTNMDWIPPTVWQKAIIEDYMIPELVFTGGAQNYFGLLKTCEQYGYEPDAAGSQLIEQCIYFGDSSVVLRNDIPRTPEVQFAGATARGLRFVVSAGDRPVKGARVVFATDRLSLVGTTDGQGKVDFSGTGLATTEAAAVTVTGPNLIPLINTEVKLGAVAP